MNTINFLIITGCALSLFAVFYIDQKSAETKTKKRNTSEADTTAH
jgi:hypothetical protein